jgi:HPt (histidine-containing phosphotransfer) domain-containing protein
MLKYQNPKILLVDMHEDSRASLEKHGYNVSPASLGHLYTVKQENRFFPLVSKHEVPQNYKEQDIVVIDMCCQHNHDSPEEVVEKVENGVFVNHSQGYVNTKPLFSKFLENDFNRILDTGGIFVVFSSALAVESYYLGLKRNSYGEIQDSPNECNNWNFLSIIGNQAERKIGDDHGSTIRFPQELPKDWLITSLLSEHLDQATYSCTFSLDTWFPNEWIPLLKNKYGSDIAGIITLSKGWVILLPNLKDKVNFTTKLITQFLPNLAPALFPEQEHLSWVNNIKYCLPQVNQFQQQIVKVQEQASLKIAELEQEIENQKTNFSYLFNLLTETGDSLGQAIKKTLIILGFKQVRDIDQELESQGIKMQNREDLRIHDYEPTLILEVKGISGFPSDEDTLAVDKYVSLRMREWKTVSIQGLTIVNHQRHLPPLDRNNDLPFRQEMLDASEHQNIGLLTTWDLHRLTRSFIQNKWKHEDIKELFYKVGRIPIIPSHYEFIGTIQRFIPIMSILGIQIEASSLKVGDRIAFELPVVFEEQECESLEFEKHSITIGQIGMLVGTKTNLTRDEARVGVRVYKIIR